MFEKLQMIMSPTVPYPALSGRDNDNNQQPCVIMLPMTLTAVMTFVLVISASFAYEWA